MSPQALRRSEIFLLSAGILLMILALVFIKFDFSLLPHANVERSDPFAAEYTLEAREAVATPTPTLLQDQQEAPPGIFLVYPAAQAVLTKLGNAQKGYSLIFRFEVYPKTEVSTFELLFNDQVIITKTLSATDTGQHQVVTLIKKPGLYQWRVKTEKVESETRTVVIRD